MKKKNKVVRYIIVKEGSVSVKYSDDLIGTINTEYDRYFDTTDNLFFEYPDIRVFVKDESLFTEKPTVFYYQDSELSMTFNGTVIFAKLGVGHPLSLTEKEIRFLMKNLKKDQNRIFHISSDMKGYMIRHYGNEWLKETGQI